MMGFWNAPFNYPWQSYFNAHKKIHVHSKVHQREEYTKDVYSKVNPISLNEATLSHVFSELQPKISPWGTGLLLEGAFTKESIQN